MQVVAIKDMANGNETVGEMWQETKIFNHNARLLDVLRWVDDRRKRVQLTIPDGEEMPAILPGDHGFDR